MKLCECGCGQPTKIAAAANKRLGHVKGQPLRFVNGHNARGKQKSPETRAKMAAYALARPTEHHERLVAARRTRQAESIDGPNVHAWLNRHYPKTGVCEDCGKRSKTDYAFLRHPEPYTHERDDYRELCRSCHVTFDFANGQRRRFTKRAAA